MRNLFNLLLLTILFSCSKETPSEPMLNNGQITLSLDLIREFSLQLDKSSKSLQLEDSDFTHVYDNEIRVNFTSVPPGYSESLTFNPSDNTQRITLPYGEYNWEIPSEDNPSPISKTLSVSGQSTSVITINEPTVDLTLNVNTDYALVTVNDDYTSNVTLTHEELSISMNIKDGYNYAYVLSGTTSTTLDLIDTNGDSYSADIGLVDSCKHYKYQLNYSEVGVSSLICVCEPFEVEERYLIPNNEPNKVTDHEGNTYGFVEICGKLWTTSNAMMTTYKNGENIFESNNDNSLSLDCSQLYNGLTIGEWNIIPCDQEYKTTHFQSCGGSYTRDQVIDSRGIAPEGWRVPTRQDYQCLIDSFESIRDTAINITSQGFTDDFCCCTAAGCQYSDFLEDNLKRKNQSLTEMKWFKPGNYSQDYIDLIESPIRNSTGFNAFPCSSISSGNNDFWNAVGENAMFIISHGQIGNTQPDSRPLGFRVSLSSVGFYSSFNEVGSLRFVKDID